MPREEPRREQLIRARALQGAGAVDVMREADLDAEALTRWVARAVTRRVLRAHLRRDGLRTAAARAANISFLVYFLEFIINSSKLKSLFINILKLG